MNIERGWGGPRSVTAFHRLREEPRIHRPIACGVAEDVAQRAAGGEFHEDFAHVERGLGDDVGNAFGQLAGGVGFFREGDDVAIVLVGDARLELRFILRRAALEKVPGRQTGDCEPELCWRHSL